VQISLAPPANACLSQERLATGYSDHWTGISEVQRENVIVRDCFLSLGRLGAVEIPLNRKNPDPGKTTKSGARPLRIAVVQMKSLDHDIDGNLRQATTYADEAAARGAQFVLFPEFMATGSFVRDRR